jgi:hypothetical protein
MGGTELFKDKTKQEEGEKGGPGSSSGHFDFFYRERRVGRSGRRNYLAGRGGKSTAAKGKIRNEEEENLRCLCHVSIIYTIQL